MVSHQTGAQRLSVVYGRCDGCNRRWVFGGGGCASTCNAAIHIGGENDTMADWLWSRFGIFTAFLLTRSPELNPIERLWNYFVQKLKTLSSADFE